MSRTRAEAKGAVAVTGANEADIPVGRPVAERPTGPGFPLSTETETVVWISLPAVTVPPALERARWNRNDCDVLLVLLVLLLVVLVLLLLEDELELELDELDDLEELVDALVLLLVLVLEVLLELELAVEDEEVDEDEDEDEEDDWDKKVEDDVLVVVLTTELGDSWIASQIIAQL